MSAHRTEAGPPSPTRRTLVLLAWLLVVLAGALQIARTSFSADLSAFLPKSPDARQQVLIEQLQSGVASRTLMLGIEGGTNAEQRAAVSRAVGRAMRESQLFDLVQNGDTSDWSEAGTWLFEHRYQLSPGMRPEHFSVDGLRDAIYETLSTLGTPAGNAIKPLLERDPTGETQRIAMELVPASAPRNDNGVWTARAAPRALLIATTRAAGDDLDAQATAIKRVHDAFDAATREFDAEVRPRLLLSGPPVFSVLSRDKIETEAIHLAVVGGIVMSILLLLAFASPRALVIAFLPVATGVVVGTAAVSLVFGSVHGMTLGFGSTLIGETVDYAIYYLIQARGAKAAGTGWARWRELHWPTVRLGLLTSICGFAALVFSGFPGLAQLGVFSIAGLASAAVATRHGLPMLAPDGASGMGMRRAMARLAGMLVRALPRLRLVLAALGVAALAIVVWQGGHLWRADLGAMSPVPKSVQQLDEMLRADLGTGDGGTLVVIRGTDEETALRNTEAATARLDALVDQGELGGYEAVTRVLPSMAAQDARLASIPDTETLRARLAEATAGSPLPRCAARTLPGRDRGRAQAAARAARRPRRGPAGLHRQHPDVPAPGRRLVDTRGAAPRARLRRRTT